MPNILLSLISLLSNGFNSIFLRAFNLIAGVGMGTAGAFVSNTGSMIGNTATAMLWSIEKFVLGIMEALEYTICSFLGIGSTIDDYTNFANTNGLTDTFVKTFKAIVGVAIVLMIIFTIFAIVRQEWQNITSKKGFSPEQNKKGPIVMKLFKGIMSIIVLPIAMVVIIGAVNSTLTAFNRAMKGDYDYTVASSVLATSSYDANKYRKYAEQNRRVPIVISAYNVKDYKPDQKDQLLTDIKSSVVQTRLTNVREKLYDVTKNLTFQESLVYENNQLINSSKYSDYYESFICTPEQYQIMAQFIDYAQLTQTNFYIRAVDDEFVDWRYVDDTVFDPNTKSLTINYRDLSDVNSNNSSADTYSITYSPSVEITSPISDALDSLKAILGVDEYSDIVYNEMEREENSLNVVKWANEKVSIHFSKNFDINKPETWTSTDEIIMYEFFHFSSNNDFANYSINDFSYIEAISNRNPVTIDAYKYVYREYYEDAGAYSPEKTMTLALINGNYYKTQLSNEEMDAYGDYYYVLSEYVEEGKDVKFLDPSYVSIYENDKDTLNDKTKYYQAQFKLSTGFDINKQSSWSYSDQIIMYEYYKDLSYANDWSSYTITDFIDGNVKMNTFTISEHPYNYSTKEFNINGNPKVYALINGTYYEVQLDATNKVYKLPNPTGKKFLDIISSGEQSHSFYNYVVKIDNYDKYGISTEETNKTADDFIIVKKDGVTNSYKYTQYFNNANAYCYYGVGDNSDTIYN